MATLTGKRGCVIRIGVTGKTGSGKTTVSALLAMACAAHGRRVIAVDTDVSPNLAMSLGVDAEALDAARSVPRAIVAGRAGGSITTDQVVRGYGLATPAGVTLLHAMAASDEVGACSCPAHASARGLLASALDEEADVAVVDMEAGLDHLERQSGTVAHVDVLAVVMEPSRKSAVTAARMIDQARAHGIARIVLVGNKGGTDDGATFAAAAADADVALAGVLPYSVEIVDADRAGTAIGLDGPVGDAVVAIVASLG